MKRIAIVYEHPEWFRPLFAELDRRELPYEAVDAQRLFYDPAAESSPYALVVNRMSPSAYVRGHAAAIFTTQQYLAHLERVGVATINGLAAYTLELSKARQLDLLARLGLQAPASRVVGDASQILPAALELDFPLIIKPNVGGSGALMRHFESCVDLETAVKAGEVDSVFGIDHTALVQEYHPPRDGAIVRVEVLDGRYLYAIRIHNDPSQGFNLCPADICQAPATEPTSTFADFDNCPVEIAPTPAREVAAFEPPPWIVDSVLRLASAARLDLGGVEYLESQRDGQVYFYDVNALSNFVADAPRLIGFDPFVLFVELIERRWRAA